MLEMVIVEMVSSMAIWQLLFLVGRFQVQSDVVLEPDDPGMPYMID